MLLRVDDPRASVFHLDDAPAHAGTRLTLTDLDGVAHGRVTLRALSDTQAEVVERAMFDPGDRYRIQGAGALEGRALRAALQPVRPEQSAFRKRVGDAWGWRCAITGEDVPEALEAAHLPGTSWRTGDNAATDGILLRADLHRLLDAGLLRIEQGVVRVSVGGYATLDGREVVLPSDLRDTPRRRGSFRRT
jgi:hypothetical protein